MNPTIHVNQLISLFDKYNVEKAVVFPNPNVGDKYPEMNDYIAESVKQYPTRLIGFGRVDPRRQDAMKELKRIKHTLNLKGMKLHPFVECFRPDHPYFSKFFKTANQLALPILFHTGDGFSSPGLVAKIARRHPKQIIILAHLREASVGALKESANTYVETSGTLPDFIEQAADIDPDRILFGSDIPYYRFPTQTAIIEAAQVSQKVKRKIFHDNFLKLFHQK